MFIGIFVVLLVFVAVGAFYDYHKHQLKLRDAEEEANERRKYWELSKARKAQQETIALLNKREQEQEDSACVKELARQQHEDDEAAAWATRPLTEEEEARRWRTTPTLMPRAPKTKKTKKKATTKKKK